MPKRILIVEDSAAMRQLLLLAIRRFPDVEADEAPDGVAALRALAQKPYDLAFLDLNMPILDGLKVLAQMQKDGSLAKTKVVVVTTEESQEVEQQALALGATAYVRKPVSRRIIDQLIIDLLAIDIRP